jgi:hypothetical protein
MDTTTPTPHQPRLLDITGLDSIVTNVLCKFKQRADFGFKKYGQNLDRNDLETLDWIVHAQEELMDAILYLEKLKTTVDGSAKK